MKWLCFAIFAGASLAQDITFTNRIVTFANLEGRVFTNVTLVRANENGVVWKGDGMGMVPYTNLSRSVLASFGVPTQRIAAAKAKADMAAERMRQSDPSVLEAEAAARRHQAAAKRHEAHLATEAGMSPEQKQFEAQLGQDEARREFVRYDYGEDPTDRLMRNYNRLTSILGQNSDTINTTNMSAYELGERLENLKLLQQTSVDLRERRAVVDRDIKQLEIDARRNALKSLLFGD